MRVSIIVRKESTTDEEALKIKRLVIKALEQIPEVDIEVMISGK